MIKLNLFFFPTGNGSCCGSRQNESGDRSHSLERAVSKGAPLSVFELLWIDYNVDTIIILIGPDVQS